MRHITHSGLAAAIACLAASTPAQTIERMRLTDNELNCTQIHAEVQQMDTMIQLAGSSPASYTPPQQVPAQVSTPAPVPPTAQAFPAMPAQPGFPIAAAQQNNFAFQGAVMADPNVRASIARARAAGMSDAQISATLGVGMQRAGLPQLPAGLGGAPAAAAGFAGIFGAMNSGAQPQAQTQAPAQAIAPVGIAQAAPKASLAQQAQARKEHLTTLFLSRNCKLADVQK